jgi:hypothetical protein
LACLDIRIYCIELSKNISTEELVRFHGDQLKDSSSEYAAALRGVAGERIVADALAARSRGSTLREIPHPGATEGDESSLAARMVPTLDFAPNTLP